MARTGRNYGEIDERCGVWRERHNCPVRVAAPASLAVASSAT